MIKALKATLSIVAAGLALFGGASAQTNESIPQTTAVAPAAAVDVPTTGIQPAVPAAPVAPVAPTIDTRKELSSAISRERQTLGYVTASYLDMMSSDEYLRILSTAGRQSQIRAPFGRKLRAQNASSTLSVRGVSTPTLGRLYICDESLESVVDWYSREYQLEFKIRRTPIAGGSGSDTLAVARAVKKIGNSIVSVMVWNPTQAGRTRKGSKGGATQKTSVEVQERSFRPRDLLVPEGPDAVVEFNWKVPYRDLIQQVSSKYQLDPYLIAALVQQESGFNATAMSCDSAIGLTQMIPGTAALMGVTDPSNPRQSLDGGMRYLKRMLERFKGDVVLALAAYNAGPGNVEKYRGVPPFAETRDYVKRIMERYQEKASGRSAPVAAAKTRG